MHLVRLISAVFAVLTVPALAHGADWTGSAAPRNALSRVQTHEDQVAWKVVSISISERRHPNRPTTSAKLADIIAAAGDGFATSWTASVDVPLAGAEQLADDRRHGLSHDRGGAHFLTMRHALNSGPTAVYVGAGAGAIYTVAALKGADRLNPAFKLVAGLGMKLSDGVHAFAEYDFMDAPGAERNPASGIATCAHVVSAGLRLIF